VLFFLMTRVQSGEERRRAHQVLPPFTLLQGHVPSIIVPHLEVHACMRWVNGKIGAVRV